MSWKILFTIIAISLCISAKPAVESAVKGSKSDDQQRIIVLKDVGNVILVATKNKTVKPADDDVDSNDEANFNDDDFNDEASLILMTISLTMQATMKIFMTMTKAMMILMMKTSAMMISLMKT